MYIVMVLVSQGPFLSIQLDLHKLACQNMLR